MKTRRFRYCVDPIFIVATAAYLANRLCLAPHFGGVVPFLTRHFGDTLLIPCALPLLLWLQRAGGLRTHDCPPTVREILGAFVVWAILFEWIFPCCLGRGVADRLDVLAYAAGALVAGLGWYFMERTEKSACGAAVV